jgi:MYXO-CTERM domain-containing protein
MKKLLCLFAPALLGSVMLFGQTSSDPTRDNQPVRTEPDRDYGWIGLLGLAGLAGLVGRNRVPRSEFSRGNATTHSGARANEDVRRTA